MLTVLVACITPFALPLSSSGSDWTRFRGPDGTGVLAERAFPADWGPESNVAWTVDVPGSGWSSPIVVGERVFVTAAFDPESPESNGPMNMADGVRDPSTRGQGAKPTSPLTFRLVAYALADGEHLWTRDVGKRVPEHPVHGSNTFATESPASDGERIFVTFGGLGLLAAFGLDGEELWRVETGVFETGNDFGWGISLVVHEDLVFLQNDNEESSFVAAFDTATGDERWRVERRVGTSWGTPVLRADDERTSLITCGPDRVVAYEPSTGAEQWRVEGIGGSFSASPSYDAERVYFGNSGPMSRGPLMAVPASLEGTVDANDAEGLAWRAERAGPGFASPLIHDGLVYVLGSSNVIACHDAATGEEVWRDRIPDAFQIVATPWVAGDELFVLDESGLTTVLQTGRELEILRTNTLEGLFWSTPSVAGDALLLREARRLYCIRD